MADEHGIIATHYRIDPARPVLALHGGFRAHPVTDRRDPSLALIAIETKPDLPLRPKIQPGRNAAPLPHCVSPIEHGPGTDIAGRSGWFAISEAPPGRALGISSAWRETDLVTFVLTPIATALAEMQSRGLTHRAINPENLFRAAPRDPVTLGPFWIAPPASLQPSVFEPPYMARCLPNGRGDGSIADDVYALGVTLLALALGRIPLAELDEGTILRRKLELGSFAALTADVVLPPLISDLLRGMLAEDPEHRPSPTLLARPEQARARRVAARPPRRAQVALQVGGSRVWSARELALALGQHPERAYLLLKSGDVERWLRRCLGDPQLGMRVEEVTRRSDIGATDDARVIGLTVLRCVAAIDPLAPLVWRGIAVHPDGVGTALADATPETLAAIQEVVMADAVGHFCAASPRRQDQLGQRADQRDWRAWLTARGPAGGVRRLTYGMNPLLACGSPLLSGRLVIRAADLLPALDALAGTADRGRPPIDAHIAAFLAARVDGSLAGDMPHLASFAGASERLSVLRLFGRLQQRLSPSPVPALAGWLMASGLASVDEWRSQKTRALLQEQLTQAAAAGSITGMVELLDNEAAREADRLGADAAQSRVRQLEDALRGINDDAPRRMRAAHFLGHELVTGAGLVASLGAAIALALR